MSGIAELGRFVSEYGEERRKLLAGTLEFFDRERSGDSEAAEAWREILVDEYVENVLERPHWVRDDRGLVMRWEGRKGEYLCPVCGHLLEDPPIDHNICECCGTEFGYDDAGLSHEEIRKEWVSGGMKWWFREGPPDGWDPKEQLERTSLFAEEGS